MQQPSNKRRSIIGLSALLIFSLTGCSTQESKEIIVAPLHASYSINTENINEVVGDADNVFVGYVEKIDGTVYKFPVTIETEDGGAREVSSPYTNYTISVVDNIKGNLIKNQPIPIQKSGGISEEDSNLYLLYEDDTLPEEGKYYIFNSYNQPDGSILVSGSHSNIELNVDSKTEIVNSKEFNDYSKAVRNQVKTDRERFESKYSSTN